MILFATLLVILISRIQQGKKNPLTYSIDDLMHDKHDTTDEQQGAEEQPDRNTGNEKTSTRAFMLNLFMSSS